MATNSRHLQPAAPKAMTPKGARELLARFDSTGRSCFINKYGLQAVVEALQAEGAGSTIVHRILTAPDGPYKVKLGVYPVTEHLRKRCACFRVSG